MIWSIISKDDTVKRDHLLKELIQVYRLKHGIIQRTRSFIGSLQYEGLDNDQDALRNASEDEDKILQKKLEDEGLDGYFGV